MINKMFNDSKEIVRGFLFFLPLKTYMGDAVYFQMSFLVQCRIYICSFNHIVIDRYPIPGSLVIPLFIEQFYLALIEN